MFLIEQNHGRFGIEIIGTPETTRRSVIAGVKSGEWDGLTRIIEMDHGKHGGSWTDITEDIANEVYDDLWEDSAPCPDHLRNFIDQHIRAGAADMLPKLQTAE